MTSTAASDTTVATEEFDEQMAATTAAGPAGVPENVPMTTYLRVPAGTIPPMPPDAGGYYPYSYGVIEGGPGGQPGELLFERTSASGVTMRGHVLTHGGAFPLPDFGIAGWTPEAWCFPIGMVRVGFTNPELIDVGSQPWFSEAYGLVDVRPLFVGAVEGVPTLGLVGRAAPTVQSVELVSPSGVADSVDVVDGVVALVVPGEFRDAHTVTATLTDGSTQAWGLEGLLAQRAGSAYRDGCEPPPPALPPAGEQPQDAAGAEADFLAAWEKARNFTETDEQDIAQYIDDSAGIAAAREQLMAGQYADAAGGAVIVMRETVFTNPTEVWFRYDLETPITNFYDRYGVANLGDDGQWRVTRATICQDLALAPGHGCAPPVERILPPSAADDPRFNPQIGPMTVPGGMPPMSPTTAAPPFTTVLEGD